MKKYIKLTALLLCVAMLTSTLAGCGLFGGGDDEPEDEFNPPYLENYYVNKHEPVVVSGGIEVYKYDKDSEALWMGGYPYYGGLNSSSGSSSPPPNRNPQPANVDVSIAKQSSNAVNLINFFIMYSPPSE